MSSGVTDQMKIPGNSAKNGEERNIPWSQQVDEASYENLASPTSDDISGAHQNSMQFQYPPFNIKENSKSPWNNYKPRKAPNDFDINKKYGKSSFYNINKRDENKQNAWLGNNPRKVYSDNSADNFKRAIKFDGDVSHKSNDSQNFTEILEEKKSSNVSAAIAPKKTTWASIASQPAKLASRTTMTASSHKKKGPGMPPPPMVPGRHNFDVNTWDLPNNNLAPVPSPPSPVDLCEVTAEFATSTVMEEDTSGRLEKAEKGESFHKAENKGNYVNYGRSRYSPNGHSRKNFATQASASPHRQMGHTPLGSTRRSENNNLNSNRSSERRTPYGDQRPEQESAPTEFRENVKKPSNVCNLATDTPQAVLDKLLDKNNYNPTEIDMQKASTARFFVIKSYSEDDIHRSIKYEIWCSTDHGNKRLDDAFKERHKKGGNILLFFSVNGSGHFCGMAQMMTAVDYNSTASVWSQDKWKGKFKVKWIYVKDVPNHQFRHIRLENNDNKSVTNSRDTQEVPNAKGIKVLQILHSYKHKTSLFDDFYHYEKRQEEEVSSKKPFVHEPSSTSQAQSPVSRFYNRQNDSAPQKYGMFTGTNYRDRNNSHRSNYDYRRLETQRPANIDQQKDKSLNTERENSEYNARNSRKADYIRRDDLKHNWERDFNEDYKMNSGTRCRTDLKDIQKDNETIVLERLRSTDN